MLKSEGHLVEEHVFPAFTELGQPWSARLVYSSAAANPTVTLRGHIDYNSTRPVERTIFQFAIEGRNIEAVFNRSFDNEKQNATYFWDGANALDELMPTGTYAYSVRAISLNADAPIAISAVFGGAATQTFSNLTYPGLTALTSGVLNDRVSLLNYVDSPLGAGWWLAEDHRLHFDPDGCVLLVTDATRPLLFAPRPGQPGAYDSRSGDFSTFTRNPGNGRYTRLLTDGTAYQFTAAGLLDRIVDRYGLTTLFQHDAGRLTRITSPTGYFYSFGYSSGKLSGVTDSAGRQTLVVVNGAGDLVSIAGPEDAGRTFEYDADHLLIAQYGARGEGSEYDYERGRVIETRAYDVDGTTLLRTRSFVPSALNGEAGSALAAGLGTLSDPIPVVSEKKNVYTDGRDGHWEDTVSGDGRTVTHVDPLGRRTLLVNNDKGLLTSQTRPNNAVLQYTYDAAGHVVQVRELADSSTVNLEWNGPFGLLSRHTDQLNRQTIVSYLPNGSVNTIQQPLAGHVTTFAYMDARFPQLATRVTDPLNRAELRTYDSHGNLSTQTDPLSRTTTFLRDAAGNVASVTDAGNRQTTFTHDDHNRMTSVLDGAGGLMQLSYINGSCGCATNLLDEVTLPGGGQLRFDYDGLQRRIAVIDQFGRSSSIEYDPEGAMTSRTNRNMELIGHQLDAAGQIVRVDLPDGESMTFAYDALGNILLADNAAAEIDVEYDFRGRATSVTETIIADQDAFDVFPPTVEVSATYNSVGNRTSMNSGLGSTSYQYDALNRLTNVTDVDGSHWTMTYGLEHLTLIQRPNGTRTTPIYDPASQITSISHTLGAAPILARVEYTAHDGSGNRTAQAWNVSPDAWTESFTYDGAHRLKSWTTSDGHGASPVNTASTFDAADRLQGDGQFTYAYDLEGRLTAMQEIGSSLVTRFDYNALGQLVRYRQIDESGPPQTLTDARYAYDALGRRVQKRVNDVYVRYAYDGPNIVQEIDACGVVTRVFTNGLSVDEPLAVKETSAMEKLYYHSDAQGNVIALTNSAGAVVQNYRYDAFGEVLFSRTAAAQPFGFTGREWDRESGLHYLRNRYYDPRIGRFLTQDPIGLLGGDANLYAYVGGNPVNRTDPYGLQLPNLPLFPPPGWPPLGPNPGLWWPPPGPNLFPPPPPPSPPPAPPGGPTCFGPFCLGPGGPFIPLPGGGKLKPDGKLDPFECKLTFEFPLP